MKKRTSILKVGILMALLWVGAEGMACADTVKIAIIDSGAKGYVHEGYTFTGYPSNYDPLYHGTTIAKLIMEGNPKAKITMLQVCTHVDGKFKPSKGAIKQALLWSMKNDIDVVNMSLGLTYDEDIDRLITLASKKYGIIFIASAGNKSFEDHLSIIHDKKLESEKVYIAPVFPASHEEVISVGSLNTSGDIAKYSHKKISDIFSNGTAYGQFGTSIATARATAQISKIVAAYPNINKEQILMLLNIHARKLSFKK